MTNHAASAIFSNPGYALLRNPFGMLPCYFLGVFYPCDPTDRLISLQEQVFERLSLGESAWFFEADAFDEGHFMDGDLADKANEAISENDQLFDVNFYFEQTKSGLCISQEESLVFCASIDPECAAFLKIVTDEYASDISRSVVSIKKFIKILSGNIEPYFC